MFAVATDSLIWSGIAAALSGAPSGFASCIRSWDDLGAALRDAVSLAEMQACQAEFARRYLPAIVSARIVGAVLLAASTLAIWWLHPLWVGWRMGLTRLDERDAPELAAALRRLCGEAGLHREPRFCWNPLGLAPWALAYGRAGRYRVALTGATAVRFTTDPEAFRATILHEFAHLANRDVDKTLFAVAIWQGLLLTGVLPLVVATIWAGTTGLVALSTLAQMVAITALVALTFNGILRAREMYADTRASSWLADTSGLARALSELRAVPRDVLRLLSPHPDPALRTGLLESTAPLFRAGFWDLLGVGIAVSLGAGFFYTAAIDAAGLAVPDAQLQFVVPMLVPAFLLVPLIAGIGVTMIWRAASLSLLRGERPGGALRGGAALGAGLVVGGVLYGLGFPAIWLTEAPPWPVVAAVGLWALLGFLPAIFLMGWSEAMATAWLPAILARSRPGRALQSAIVLCCVLALPWFALAGPIGIGAMLFYELYPMLRPMFPVALPVMLFAVMGTWLMAAMAAVAGLLVWGVPLAASSWRRPERRVAAAWTFLEPPAGGLPPLECMRSWPGVLSGVFGGVLGGIALLWATVPLPRATVQAIGFPATFVPGLRLIASAILVQALVAASAVVVTERLKLIHAMFAAFLAANILVFAMGVRAALHDARWHTVFFTLRFSYAPTVIGGLTVALAVALLALLLTRAISALRALIWREAPIQR